MSLANDECDVLAAVLGCVRKSTKFCIIREEINDDGGVCVRRLKYRFTIWKHIFFIADKVAIILVHR